MAYHRVYYNVRKCIYPFNHACQADTCIVNKWLLTLYMLYYLYSGITGIQDHTTAIAYLKIILFNDTLLNILANYMQDSQHGNVRFAGSSRCTDEHVFICVISRFKNYGLDTVQSFQALEDQLSNLMKEKDRKIINKYYFF